MVLLDGGGQCYSVAMVLLDGDGCMYSKPTFNHCNGCTVMYCTVLYCTVLYCKPTFNHCNGCTVLYCTVLYCTVLCTPTLPCVCSCNVVRLFTIMVLAVNVHHHLHCF